MRAVLLRLKPNLNVAELEVPAKFLPVDDLHLHIDGPSSRNRHMKAYAGSDVIDRFYKASRDLLAIFERNGARPGRPSKQPDWGRRSRQKEGVTWTLQRLAGLLVCDALPGHNRMGVTARPSCTSNKWRPQYST